MSFHSFLAWVAKPGRAYAWLWRYATEPTHVIPPLDDMFDHPDLGCDWDELGDCWAHGVNTEWCRPERFRD